MSPRPLRRTQAISPFGVGAMVDFPGAVSLIHCGLDSWPFNETDPNHREFKIEDETRLAARVGVSYFVLPPDFRFLRRGEETEQPNLNMKLPFLRFPRWHVCPRCGRMFECALHDKAAPVCEGPVSSGKAKGKRHNKRKTVQVRFVAACVAGHLQDFPWWEWVYQTPSPELRGRLRMNTSGSASLAGIKIVCEEDTEEIRVITGRTLAGAFESEFGEASALSRLKIVCRGHNPALGIPSSTQPAPGCNNHLYPLLRGGSNVYFAHVVSSIYVPDFADKSLSEDMLEILEDHYVREGLLDRAEEAEDGLISARVVERVLRKYRPHSAVDPVVFAEAANKHLLIERLKSPKIWAFLSQYSQTTEEKRINKDMIQEVIEREYPGWQIDPDILVEAVNRRLLGGDTEAGDGESIYDGETSYRRQEFEVFCSDIHEGYPKTNLLIRSERISEYSDGISGCCQHISLIHKLRETRAFVGFSRIFPENDLDDLQRRTLISREPKEWLPAMVVRGEGIFLQFREDRIVEWLESKALDLEERIEPIRNTLAQLRERRNQQPRPITPRFVMLHTLSHLLINQLTYECGYGSASLRERLYSADAGNPMAGILIYTAAGDSEGTMGGLVRMGQPGRLEAVFSRALEKARWCSTDPVCIESSGQGPDNCNRAACHSCVLLPETSCEEQNRFLDRGVVVGTIDHPELGFLQLLE